MRLAFIGAVAFLPFLALGQAWYFEDQPTLVAEFKSVVYNWTGGPFATDTAAIAAGKFVVKNNIITGINRYGGQTFLCVPRWFPGVPSTLNTLTFDTAGNPMLTPWPNWEWQDVFVYVQAVFIDQRRGEMWVIDTGRLNIFDPATLVNGNAKLYIFNISTKTCVFNVTFPDHIFPVTSSFLNDIVVDTTQQIAYMTDTNVAGLGAVVSYSRYTGLMYRFEDPASTYKQANFVINVNGVAYPWIQNPVDGIALSGDCQTLFYSSVDGDTIYSIPTIWIAPQSQTPNSVSALYVDTAFVKGTASDGMMWLPTSQYGQLSYANLPSPGVTAVSVTSSTGLLSSAASLWSNAANCQWVDTFAVFPRFDAGASPIPGVTSTYYNGITSFELWFTTNKLQFFFNQTMDFSQVNMRVYHLDFNDHEQQNLARAKLLLGVGIALLALVFVVYCFFWRRFAAPMAGPKSRPLSSSG